MQDLLSKETYLIGETFLSFLVFLLTIPPEYLIVHSNVLFPVEEISKWDPNQFPLPTATVSVTAHSKGSVNEMPHPHARPRPSSSVSSSQFTESVFLEVHDPKFEFKKKPSKLSVDSSEEVPKETQERQFKHTLTQSGSASASLKIALEAKRAPPNAHIPTKAPSHDELISKSTPPPKPDKRIQPHDFSLGDGSEDEEDEEEEEEKAPEE
jgi:hypothetical protein